jgi:hypothetical protein
VAGVIRRLWRWRVGRAKRLYDAAHGISTVAVLVIGLLVLVILGVIVIR